MKLGGFILGGALLLGAGVAQAGIKCPDNADCAVPRGESVNTAASYGDPDDAQPLAAVMQLSKDLGACLYGNGMAIARLHVLTANGGLCVGYEDNSEALAGCGATITAWAATDSDINTQLARPGGNVTACNAALADWGNGSAAPSVLFYVLQEINEINTILGSPQPN